MSFPCDDVTGAIALGQGAYALRASGADSPDTSCMWIYDPDKAAARIRQLQLADGRSAAAISRAATGFDDAVKDIKRGREPAVTRAFNLAHELKVDVAYLIAITDEMESPATEVRRPTTYLVDTDALKYAVATVIRSNLAETDGYVEDEHVPNIVERIARLYERTLAARDAESL